MASVFLVPLALPTAKIVVLALVPLAGGGGQLSLVTALF